MNRLLALSFVLISSLSHATEEKNCTFTNLLMRPGFDFFNSGTYAGGEKKTTSFTVVDCQKKDSPLYALVVPIVPAGFSSGLEGDVRVGGRFRCGAFDCDFSGALYTYKADKTHVWETGNLRATVSKSFDAVLGGKVTPYVWADEQLPFQMPRQSYFGGRAGVNYSANLASLPSAPTLGIDLSTWHYFSAPTSGKTMVVEDISLGFHPQIGSPGNNFTIGPFYRRTQGATDFSGIGDIQRWMFGGVVSFKF